MTIKAQYSYGWKSMQRKRTRHQFYLQLSQNMDMATVVLIEMPHINTGKADEQRSPEMRN
jgi:hypothetical protein